MDEGVKPSWHDSWPLFVLVSVPVLLLPLVQLLALSPVGGEAWFLLQLPVILSAFLPAAGFVLCLLFLLHPRSRRIAFRGLLASVIWIVSIGLGVIASERVRAWRFTQLAERSRPLVEAVKAWEREKGSPPPDLDALVPTHLPSVPTTGMGAYPNYEYFTGTSEKLSHGNSWMLSVPTPRGFINWDQFIYFPLQNYPERSYGGLIQPVGDWAYVHE